MIQSPIVFLSICSACFMAGQNWTFYDWTVYPYLPKLCILIYRNLGILIYQFLCIVIYRSHILFDNKKFRYGFTVRRNPNYLLNASTPSSKEIIEKEWLYGTKDKNMGRFFERTGIEVSVEKSQDQEKVPPLPYSHSLFLTHEAAFNNGGSSAQIRTYLKGWTLSNLFKDFEQFRWNTLYLIERENKKNEFLKLLSAFNLIYDDLIVDRDENSKDKILPHDKIIFRKSFINGQNEAISVNLNLARTESAGTQKLFDIAGLLLRAFNLQFPTFICIDEVDSNFHPSLLIKIIQLFNNPAINKTQSQLLFTSHDTNLMSPSIMRRDQFYFAEKKSDNSTRLYSLADLKGVRNDADFARQYLMGYYGAVPFFENYFKSMPNSLDGTVESKN